LTRLVLLPGLGADGALFDPQRVSFPDLEVPEWLEPLPRETLPAFAVRMAARAEHGGPLVLGGVSFGGMVALEMARVLRPAAVVLVASCRSGTAVRGHMRALGKAWSRVPPGLIRGSPALAPLVAWGFGAHTPAARALIRHFLETRSPAFVQWGLAALLDWAPTEALPCPVYHVHGGADRLIPAARVSANRVVPGAGHLVNVTHAEDVNGFQRGVLRGL
jgi:pimeloyl-ACP methyl ester carboxylesterase